MGNKQTTTLHSAVQHNCGVCIDKSLKDSEVDVNAKDKQGDTALHKASKEGLEDVVQKLLNQDNINVDELNNQGQTAVHYAGQEGFPSVVELLTVHNASVNLQDQHGNTPLHLAVQEKKNRKSVKRLLQLGADVNIFNNDGDTPVHIAVREADISMLKGLLGSVDDILEVDLNCRNNEGFSPVHLAALSNNEKVMKYVLQKGGDVLGKTIKGETPLELSQKKNRKVSAAVLRQYLEDKSVDDQRKVEEAEQEKKHISMAAAVRSVMLAKVMNGKQIKNANNKLSKLSKDRHLLRQKNFKYRVQLLKLDDQIGKQANSLAEVQDEVRSLQNSLREKHQQVAAIENEHHVLKVSGSALVSRIEQQQDAIGALEKEKARLLIEVQETQNQVKQLEQNMAKHGQTESVHTAGMLQTYSSSTVEQRLQEEDVSYTGQFGSQDTRRASGELRSETPVFYFRGNTGLAKAQKALSPVVTRPEQVSEGLGQRSRSTDATDFEVITVQLQAEKQRLEEENTKLKDESGIKDLKIKELEKTVEGLQAGLEQAEEENQQIELELKMHAQQMETKKKQTQQMSEAMMQLNYDKSRLEQENSFLDTNLVAVQQDLRRQKDELAQAQNLLHIVKRNIQGIADDGEDQEEFVQIRSGILDQVQELYDLVMEQKQQEKHQEIGDHDQQDNIQELLEHKQALEAELEELHQHVKLTQAEKSSIWLQLNDFKIKHSKALIDKENADKNANIILQENDDLRKKVQSLQSQNENYLKERAATEKYMKSINAHMQSLAKQKRLKEQAHQQQVDKLKLQLNNYEELKAQYETLEAGHHNVLVELQELKIGLIK